MRYVSNARVQPSHVPWNCETILDLCSCFLQARRMLREADANGDGRISKEEFVALLQEASMRDSLDQYDSRYSGARAELTVGE